MTEKCLQLLARHELYVARFYMDRDAWEGAAGRLRTLLATYAGSGLEPKALLLLGQVYLELSDRAQARQAFGELLERYPDAAEAADARTELRRLRPTRQSAPAG
jgi:outer membrane protein assembly factor BamD